VHRVAYLASATNALAAAAMLVLLKPGLLGDQAWIASHKPLWIFGWLLWQLAAISLVAFYAALSIRFRDRAPIRCHTALVVAGAGLAADLAAETYLMIRPDALRMLAPLTGYLGNGCYTVAGALLLWAGARGLPRWLILLGVLTFAAGVALSAATLAESQIAEQVTTAALMPLFVLWSFAMGRWLRAS
jgi:hypothetical protein